MTIAEIVRYIFDEPLSNNDIENIVYSCTGYPSFFRTNNHTKEFIQQLYHAKRSLKRGNSPEDIYFGEEK